MRMRWLELRIPPLLLWFLFAGGMLGVAWLVPALSFPSVGRRIIALALFATGVAVAVAGVLAFRSKGTTVNPMTPAASSAIVASGVYRYSRNPMYLGFFLALAGLAVYLSNIPAALLLPAFVAYLTRFQIRPEERALVAKFGTRYTQYMGRVRRWI